MASRWQRRKRAIAKAKEYAAMTTEQKHSLYVQEVVRRNLASPRPERSFAPSSVALVAEGAVSGKVKAIKTLPYQKHKAGKTPVAATYPIDRETLTMGERKLRQERATADTSKHDYPVVE